MQQNATLRRPPIRVLDITGNAEARGHAHGTTYRDEIRAYTEERISIVADGSWSGGSLDRADILDLADAMVQPHLDHHPDLGAEMLAMATAAGITPAEAVIVGGFTDFVDTVRSRVGGATPDTLIEDDCTAVLVPDHRADGAGFFAQTWDMHDSATDYVIMLRVAPDDGPAALVFTTTGALGQIGMNEVGVCVGINNLVATDGKVGVTWPQVVRAALLEETAEAARDVILDADLAGGHNFCVFDGNGQGWNIEAMPTARPVTELADDAIVHTNHTLDTSTLAVQGPRSDVLQDSSERRLDIASKTLDATSITAEDLMELTREPTAVCQRAEAPYHIESSGAAVMRPATGDFWAVWGRPDHNEYQKISFVG